jgi:hypothetical protein
MLRFEAVVALLADGHQAVFELEVVREFLEYVRACAASSRWVRPRKAGGRTHDDV